MTDMQGDAARQAAESREELKRYLEREISQHQSAARLKLGLAHALFWTAIVASALATFNVGTGWFAPSHLNVLAAVPGVVLAIMGVFKYDARARWNKLKQRKLEALRGKLLHEGHSPADVSRELTAVLEELETSRVAFGTLKA